MNNRIEWAIAEVNQALIGWITEDIISVSISVSENQDIKLRIIVEEQNNVDHDMIEDISVELSALMDRPDQFEKCEVYVKGDKKAVPLDYLVFAKSIF